MIYLLATEIAGQAVFALSHRDVYLCWTDTRTYIYTYLGMYKGFGRYYQFVNSSSTYTM